MIVDEFEKIIEPDYENIISKLGDNLISIFVIGSMKDKNTVFKKYNDYDLRIVLKEMDCQSFKEIEEFNKKIKTKLSEPQYNLDVDYSFIIGPVRHVTKSKTNLLIHCIPMTVGVLEGLPHTHRYSYACNYRMIYGEDLIQKYKDVRYTGNDVINCTEGINYCLDMINKGETYFAKWTMDEDSLKVIGDSKKTDDNSLFEVLRYSISKSLKNTIKVISWDKENNGKTIPQELEDGNVTQEIKMIYKDIPKDRLNRISKLYNCTFEEFQENKDILKLDAIDILNKTKDYIINNHL